MLRLILLQNLRCLGLSINEGAFEPRHNLILILITAFKFACELASACQ